MNRKFKVIIAVALVMIMSMSQMALAKSNNGIGWGQNKELKASWGHGRESAPGYRKKLEKFTLIDGKRIKVNDKNLDFNDAPPMIKNGRTLIPVRAITEALDGLVFWDGVDFIATIISPEGDVMIRFYLSEDNYGGHVLVYKSEGGLTELADDGWVFDGEVDLDVLPGIHENRTYVPLRFIGELFGLGVHYDPWTGAIDIIDGPTIIPDPDNLDFDFDIGISEKSYEIFINEKGSEFEKVLELSPDTDYTTESAIDFGFDNLPDYATGATLVLKLKDDAFDDYGEFDFILEFAGDIQAIFRELTVNIK